MARELYGPLFSVKKAANYLGIGITRTYKLVNTNILKSKNAVRYTALHFCFLTRNRECATMIKRCRIKRLSLIYEEAHVSLALSTLAS